MPDDLIILTRTFDLLTWLLPRAEKFPKVYRHTVTQRMMNAALDFQEALYDAQSQSGTTRQKHIHSADAHLNKLRLYLRLAHHWGWLNDGQYRHVSVMVAEIGGCLTSVSPGATFMERGDCSPCKLPCLTPVS